MLGITRSARTRRVPTAAGGAAGAAGAAGATAAVFLLAVVLAGCSASSGRAPAGTTVAGFPLGSFSKVLDDPDKGRARVVWTFAADGRFTEVPIALDGQRFDAYPVRGTYTADGETVTIGTSWPPDMGTSTHGWRLEGDRLWTFLLESTNPEDREWFEDLDSRPWEPYQP